MTSTDKNFPLEPFMQYPVLSCELGSSLHCDWLAMLLVELYSFNVSESPNRLLP